MSYKEILNEIKPSKREAEKVHEIAENAIKYINKKSQDENIGAKAILVGSVAKDTWLSGKADIDIFINFPLNTSASELKEKGLYLSYSCNEALNGIAEEHYASHPYVTAHVSNYDIDFVPCYDIKCSSELKSAVDRTVLHTKYILKHLKENQKEEVLLLKKFMTEIGTYGSEFKVGGFSGYLCEILILKYTNFEEVLKAASNWKNKTVIDLENYNTSHLFRDPLIAIDPIDKNRNVGAALTKQKMTEFIITSRNFLDSKSISYFHNDKRNILKSNIISRFKDRESKVITLKFNIPNVSVDSIYPQLKKTSDSIAEKLKNNDFSVFKNSYWTNEDKIAILIFELNVYIQNKYIIHKGPKVWNKKASDRFLDKYGQKCYILEDTLVLNKQREFKTSQEFIKHVLSNKNIHLIKVGKNLKKHMINSYKLSDIEYLLNKGIDDLSSIELNSFLLFLDDFLSPGQMLKR